ncbi:MAG: MGMT family protein [Bdellovibrionales bacterium]|nr:MGMT family protein [Bdellovibrionales bacterium]
MKTAPTEFTTRVIATIAKIPRGKVATYKQIAALSGKPHGSRGVAWILNSSSQKHKLPWYRVLSSRGRISFPLKSKHYVLQMAKLKREGVRFKDNGDIDMAKYQWKKKVAKPARLQPRMFS